MARTVPAVKTVKPTCFLRGLSFDCLLMMTGFLIVTYSVSYTVITSGSFNSESSTKGGVSFSGSLGSTTGVGSGSGSTGSGSGVGSGVGAGVGSGSGGLISKLRSLTVTANTGEVVDVDGTLPVKDMYMLLFSAKY